MIEQFQPFQGEHPFRHALYLLNRLDNEDKHRVIPVLLATLNEPTITPTLPPHSEFEYEIEVVVGAVEEGSVIARYKTTPLYPEMQVQGTLSYDITFGGGIFKGDPLIFVREACHVMTQAVEEVIDHLQPFLSSDHAASNSPANLA